jgi:copper transport protein
VTNVALGAVRALDYASIALVLGSLAFLLRLTPPSLRGGPFEGRVLRLLVAGLALGIPVGVLGILLQAARDSGLSLWSLRWAAVSNVLDSRFGWSWGIRTVVLAVALAVLLRSARRPPSAWLLAVGAYLAVTPALSGHASVQAPVWVFFPSDVAHVLAAGVWVGGVACVVFALPAAIAAADPRERIEVLADVLARFSRVALACVSVIALTGVVQAYIEVRSVNALTHTTYGELVLLKIGLLGLLIGLGAINRERVLPTLRRLRVAGSAAGTTGVLLARTTRGELAAMTCVFAVTAALVAYTPPVARATVRGGIARAHTAARSPRSRTADVSAAIGSPRSRTADVSAAIGPPRSRAADVTAAI